MFAPPRFNLTLCWSQCIAHRRIHLVRASNKFNGLGLDHGIDGNRNVAESDIGYTGRSGHEF
jgi:hypothetical protein